jgi:IS1 family transposase
MAVARESRLVVGYRVLDERSWEPMQQQTDELPQATRYCSDDLSVYSELLWPEGSAHVISEGKEETYTIEGKGSTLTYALIWVVSSAGAAASLGVWKR